MYTYKIMEVEGQAVSILTGESNYISFVGEGVSLRSPQGAIRRAMSALKADKRRKTEEYPGGGVPVLRLRTLTKNGKIVFDEGD